MNLISTHCSVSCPQDNLLPTGQPPTTVVGWTWRRNYGQVATKTGKVLAVHSCSWIKHATISASEVWGVVASPVYPCSSPPGRPDSLTFHQQMMSARQLLANAQPESHRVEGLKHKVSRCLYGDDLILWRLHKGQAKPIPASSELSKFPHPVKNLIKQRHYTSYLGPPTEVSLLCDLILKVAEAHVESSCKLKRPCEMLHFVKAQEMTTRHNRWWHPQYGCVYKLMCI
jgi:hypothetical protein